MPTMPPQDDSAHLAHVGRRLKHKVQLAIALSGVLPLLVLAYVVHGYGSSPNGAGKSIGDALGSGVLR
jgi:hypothetical protein